MDFGGKKKEGGIKGIESYLKKIVRAYTFGETSIEFNDFLKKRKTRSFQFSNLESALESALKDSLKEKKKLIYYFHQHVPPLINSKILSIEESF